MSDTIRRALHNLSHGEHPVWRIVTVGVVGFVLWLQASSFDKEWWVLAVLGGSEALRGAKR